MRNQSQQQASLVNLAGPHLPRVVLSVSSRYQFCVDAGALAATAFFDDSAVVGLHDHIACSMEVFAASVCVGMTATDGNASASMQAFIDAFAAGYLGRVQQELRLFHGEGSRHVQSNGGLNESINIDKMH